MRQLELILTCAKNGYECMYVRVNGGSLLGHFSVTFGWLVKSSKWAIVKMENRKNAKFSDTLIMEKKGGGPPGIIGALGLPNAVEDSVTGFDAPISRISLSGLPS